MSEHIVTSQVHHHSLLYLMSSIARVVEISNSSTLYHLGFKIFKLASMFMFPIKNHRKAPESYSTGSYDWSIHHAESFTHRRRRKSWKVGINTPYHGLTCNMYRYFASYVVFFRSSHEKNVRSYFMLNHWIRDLLMYYYFVFKYFGFKFEIHPSVLLSIDRNLAKDENNTTETIWVFFMTNMSSAFRRYFPLFYGVIQWHICAFWCSHVVKWRSSGMKKCVGNRL